VSARRRVGVEICLIDFWGEDSHLAGMTAIIAGVFVGNVLTVCFVAAIIQFQRHDYRAPWVAYAGFLMPLAFAAAVLASTEGLPPQFDAVAPRQSVAQSR
jgi:hypothetical protein